MSYCKVQGNFDALNFRAVGEHWFGHCNMEDGFDLLDCYILAVWHKLFVDGQVAVWSIGSVGNLTELVSTYDTNLCWVNFKFS